jgi:hypothetical protein
MKRVILQRPSAARRKMSMPGSTDVVTGASFG